MPRPTGKISVSKTTITTKESIMLSATGDFDHVSWTTPNGRSTSTSISFSSSDPGRYDISLTSFSRKERKRAEDNITITVIEPPPGQLMVWTPNPNLAGAQIYVDGDYKGTITGFYPNGINNSPCGSAYCVTCQLSEGNHVVTASVGSFAGSGSVNIISNGCTKFYIN